MYLSEMDLLKARLTAEGRLSQSRILQEILREDSQSEQKRKMREGERYYAEGFSQNDHFGNEKWRRGIETIF